MSSRRGVLVIISSPSGAGKTTLARRLLSEFSGAATFSISYTTRPERPNETNGVDYYFVDDPTFDAMIERGEFAEWAHVHGNRYGTSKAVVEDLLASGRDVVCDVDWQGGRRLSALWPDDALTIFILPPDLETLEHRLRRRATDSAEVIERRLRMAIEEMTHHTEYQHLVLNDELDRAYAILRAIYLTRRDGEGAGEALAELVQKSCCPEVVAHARQMVEAGTRVE